jgi:16S rRNA (adenine1518-N6/adenine1519-N6)-dimethyltransferase
MPIPKKSLGQNFLLHARIAERIALSARILPTDTVLEIGPGTGMLTKPLLAASRRVIAVEADRALLQDLQAKFSEEIAADRLELQHADIREFNPASIVGDYRVVANIPYYITGEIIRSFLGARHKPLSMTLLVQKEVAVRIARAKKESLLSLSVKVYGNPQYCFTVPRGAFFPAPNVDSAVISIQNIDPNAFPDIEAEERFFSLIRAGFAHKRKQLVNNLEEYFTKNSIIAGFDAAKLAIKIRPEDLSLEQWKILTVHIEKSVF